MKRLTTLDDLHALYPDAAPLSLTKVTTRLTPLYRAWIDAARFVVLATVGPEGTDASPRGDSGPVVRVADETTLLLPDWRGNNRLDSLRNILRDGRVSLMFMVPGSDNVVRINGRAHVTDDTTLRASFERDGKRPATVIVISLAEAYFQCAKAIMRSGLWSADMPRPEVPTAGDFLREAKDGFDGKSYDDGYAEHARDKMW